MALKTGTDHRRFPRKPFNRAVKCKTSVVEVFAGYLAQDISSGGLRVRVNEFMPVGARLKVQVQLEDQGKVYVLDGKVVWVRQLACSDGCQIGLEFVEGEAFQKLKIAQFVHKSKGA